MAPQLFNLAGTIANLSSLFPVNQKLMSLNEFLFLFRRKTESRYNKIPPEKMLSFNSKWNDWITGLAIKDQLSAQLKHWDLQGKILRSGNNKPGTLSGE